MLVTQTREFAEAALMDPAFRVDFEAKPIFFRPRVMGDLVEDPSLDSDIPRAADDPQSHLFLK